jgi:hypothetical protein
LSCHSAGVFLPRHVVVSLGIQSAVLVFSLMITFTARAQVSGAPSEGSNVGDLMEGQTRFIPAVSFTERYDSNVWYGFTPPGAKNYDYASGIQPQLTVDHKGKFAEGTLMTSGIAEFYVNNPSLNYVGATANLSMNLNQLVQQLDRRLSLAIIDQFVYTTQLQGFVNPVPGQAPAFPGGPVGSGIQTFRVTTSANSGSLKASYILAPKISFQTTYTHYLVSFGGTIDGQTTGVPVFGISSHAITAGPQFKITQRDSLDVKYAYSHASFTSTTPTLGGTFSTHGGTLGWTRQLSPSLSGTVSAGANMLDAGDTPDAGGSNLLYIASASLQWNFEKNSAATLSYSRAVTPGFFGVPVPLISNTVNISASRAFTQKLRLIATANYAHNEDTASIIRFISYGGTLALTYDLTRSVTATVNYIYYNYDSKFIGQIITFDRNALMLSLRMAWN